MEPDATRHTVTADNVGIHFRRASDKNIVVPWGEVEQICALREAYADGTPFVAVYVDHVSGVDFQFHSVEPGYEQVLAEMEKHLIGFDRAALEKVRTFEEEGEELPVIWVRDEALQPFELQPPTIDPREPTQDERTQMEAAHRASIATCERILGRPLRADEHASVHTTFENGRITGNIAAPLCQLLIERQSDA